MLVFLVHMSESYSSWLQLASPIDQTINPFWRLIDSLQRLEVPDLNFVWTFFCGITFPLVPTTRSSAFQVKNKAELDLLRNTK